MLKFAHYIISKANCIMFFKPVFSLRKFFHTIIYIYCIAAALPASAQQHYYGNKHAVKKDPAANNIAGIRVLSLRSAWHDFRWNQSLISVIMWGSLLSIYMSLLLFFGWNVWKLFLLGIPGQIAIFLWFRMFRKPARKAAEQEETQDGE